LERLVDEGVRQLREPAGSFSARRQQRRCERQQESDDATHPTMGKRESRELPVTS
jgi:hypothetical protein